MEQRWNVRTPFELEVTVHTPEQDAIPGTTRDVSFGGMYVEAAADTRPADKTLVDVTVSIDGNRETISGLVVRSGQQGFGVMFTDLGQRMLALLHGLAHGSSTPALEIPAFDLSAGLA